MSIKHNILISLSVLLSLILSLLLSIYASAEYGEALTRISGRESASSEPTVSSDGRYVAFVSNYSVYVHDQQTGTTEQIEVETHDAVISGDGQHVAFPANGLAGDTTIFTDIFVHSRDTGINQLASVASDGTQANGHNRIEELGAISADGRYVVFESQASNLVPGDNNGDYDIFVRDLQLGVTIRASAATDGSLGPAVISGNGQFVAFRKPGGVGLFIYDIPTGITEEIDETVQEQMFLSHDGRYVSFVSFIDHVAEGDTNGLPDVFLHDRLTQTTEQVSVDAESDGYFLGGISADGRYVAFTPNELNIIVRDRVAHETVLVEGDGAELMISDNGRFVVFEETSGIEPDDLNGFADIYIRDLTIAKTTETLVRDQGADGIITTDIEDNGATESDVIETTITTPNPGSFSIFESLGTFAPPSGFEFLGLQVIITAPAGTATNPLMLAFRLDASVIPTDENPNSIRVFRNGALVSSCNDMSGIAAPDPCLLSSTALEDGDAEVTVLTSSASTWNIGFQIDYAFSGFFQPVDNLPTLNAVKAGQSIPVKFSLSGNQGLDIFAAGSPGSQTISCDSNVPIDNIEETVTAGSSTLSYDPAADRYTYVWKTNKAWSNTCRQLVLKLADDSEHRAIFKFK